MGGSGSGRFWHYGAKDTTDIYRALDIRRWQRDGLLSAPRYFNWQWSRDGETVASINVNVEAGRVVLRYKTRSSGEDWMSQDYPVYIERTPCHFGGARPWFRCPAKGCGRRVAVLYGGAVFACRNCYDLAYPSQREAAHDRKARKAEKIRQKLGWEPGILNGNGLKPKGMHWQTFYRLQAHHDAYVDQSLAGMMRRFNLTAEYF